MGKNNWMYASKDKLAGIALENMSKKEKTEKRNWITFNSYNAIKPNYIKAKIGCT